MRDDSDNSSRSNENSPDDVSKASKKGSSVSSDNGTELKDDKNNSSTSSNSHEVSKPSSKEISNSGETLPGRSGVYNHHTSHSRISQPLNSERATLQHRSSSNSRITFTSRDSQSKKEQALQDEATRLFCEMASDPDIMDQAFSAAVNPNVAKELARQADTAWRNIETLPGGFRALCQMHHNLQQPLWNAVIGQDLPKVSKYQGSDLVNTVPNEPIKAEPMPNPWKTDPPKPINQSHNSFPFSDFNPFSFSNFNENLPGSSQGQRNDVLSAVISRTSPNSFQTASQLIQNSASRYSKEIEELAEMGLTDREKCLSALEEANGDLFQALGILQNRQELEKEESNNK